MGMSFFCDTQEESDENMYFQLPWIKQKDKKEAVSLTFDARYYSVYRKI